MSDLLETVLRDTLQKRSTRIDPAARGRVMATDYRPRRWRLPVLPALGAAGLAGAAVALALIFTLGSSPTPAFAGWSPVPTLARPGETAAAIARCGLGRPVLIDTRGPFTAAVFANPKIRSQVPGVTQTISPPPPPVKKSVGTCLVAPTFSFAGAAQSALAPVHRGQIQVSAGSVSGGAESATVLDGRIGSGVTEVRIDLSDGRRVTATVSHGWYLVWWPGSPHAVTIQITSRGRTGTFPAPAAAREGVGSCGACASQGPVMTVGR